ncbi:hypothetical protein [Gordonia paraffinivorans]|uniref:hypothetical protein n=1 Tax=Gordonia paraffinivorans TaxID=175628 RepID=UPI003FCCCA26
MSLPIDIHSRHPKPTASIIYVDPQMARRVLAKNTRNRPIQEAHVRRLMNEMTSGRWQYNGEAIKWSVDDVLLDGQHRLTALSRMDDYFPAIPFLVVRNLPADAQNTMDQGRTRAAADQLVIDGLAGGEGSKIIAGAIRVYLDWERGNFFSNRTATRISNTEVVAWAHDHPIEMDMMRDIVCTSLRRVKCRPSVTLAVMLRLRMVDGEAQREFANALYTGANLQPGSPILVLRDRLDRIKEARLSTSDRDLVGFFVTAWNAWREGRTIVRLQRPHGGSWTKDSFPEPR